MKRKRKLFMNLCLIVLLVYMLVFRIGDLYFTQTGLLRVHERAIHRGPSEEILIWHENPDGMGLVVGLLADGSYSAFTTERAGGIFQRYTGGCLLRYDEDVVVCIFTKQKCVLIVSWNPEIKEVYFQYEAGKGHYGPNAEKLQEETVTLDRRGFAFLDLYGKETVQGQISPYTEYIEGRDADGNVVWTSGVNLFPH